MRSPACNPQHEADDHYYQARIPTGAIARLGRRGQAVVVIGDAAWASTCQVAITQAFEAALLGRHVASI